MIRPRYGEIETSGALNRVRGMGFKWSLNPYQGCAHGCHYCFARNYSYFQNLDPGRDFSDIVFAKVNLPEVLHHELSRRSWRREEVTIGTATDPYQPIEGKYRLTRRCLEVLYRKRNPISLITKGTLVVRDVDILSELSRNAACTVLFSITTMDKTLGRRLEPGTSPPLKRLQAMQKLVSAGINAGVILAPVVPGITDETENLTEVVRAAAQHGARFLHSNVLFLKEGTKQHFLNFLQDQYPRLVTPYRGVYSGVYAPRELKQSVQHRVTELKNRHGFGDREPAPPVGQLQLQLAA